MTRHPLGHPQPPRRVRLGERLRLARAVSDIHYFQPATAFWRILELEVVAECLAGLGGDPALDLGCGDGTLASIYLDMAGKAHWIGLDIDRHDCRQAAGRDLFRSVVAGSAVTLPLADGSVELVFANSALEHMPHLERVLNEVERILAPGGRLVFTVPEDTFHGVLLWPRLLRGLGLSTTAQRYLGWLDRRVHHVNYLSARCWRSEMERRGLVVEREVRYLDRWAIGIWETFSNLTGGLAYWLAGGDKSPREIQQSQGLRGEPSRVLGFVVWCLLLPLLWITGRKTRSPTGALCLVARKPEEPSASAGPETV